MQVNRYRFNGSLLVARLLAGVSVVLAVITMAAMLALKNDWSDFGIVASRPVWWTDVLAWAATTVAVCAAAAVMYVEHILSDDSVVEDTWDEWSEVNYE